MENEIKRTPEHTERMMSTVKGNYEMVVKLLEIKGLKTDFSKNDLINATVLGHSQAEAILSDLESYGFLKVLPRNEKPPLYRLVDDVTGIRSNLKKIREGISQQIIELEFQKESYSILAKEMPKIVILKKEKEPTKKVDINKNKK